MENCDVSFSQRQQLVRHLAVDHERLEGVYNRVVEALRPFAGAGDVVVDKCFFDGCSDKSKMMWSYFVLHLSFSHFKAELLKEVRNFQVRMIPYIIASQLSLHDSLLWVFTSFC